MTSRVQMNRSSTTGTRPPSTRPVGELFVNYADNQLSVVDPTPAARDFLPVRYHAATAAYLANDIVRQGTGLYQAKANIPAHAFSAIEWNQFLTNAQGDARWLPLAGGTMTGLLTLSGPPTSNLHAATKLYVDTADLTKLPLAGGTLTGPLTLAADPTQPLHASTKQYADTKLALAGGTMTGALTLSGAPVNNLHAATKLYADTQDALRLPLTGGTLTGPLVLAADPTADLQASTKRYVDTKVGAYLPLTGGTLSGNLATSGSVLATGGVYVAQDAQPFGFYVTTNDRVFIFGATSYWDWNAPTGNLSWSSSVGYLWNLRTSDGLAFNNVAAVGGNGAYVNISDERTKTDIGPSPYGLDHVLQLQPILFHRLKLDGTPNERVDIGFGAQQVQPIIPEAVTTAGFPYPDTLAVSIDGIVAALVGAVQQLDQRVTQLEAPAP